MSSVNIASTKPAFEAWAASSFYGWTRVRRFMPDGRPYSIYRFPFFQPYLRELYDRFSSAGPGFHVVVQKAAQMGWSEFAINLALWFMETKNENVLYMLPSFSQLADFSHARLEQAISRSPHIRSGFTSIDNVGLKIGWGAALYLRGSNAKEKLLEIPVGLLIRDEYDRMDPEGAAQAETRLGASRWAWKLDISNPSRPGEGINALWLKGSQGVWEIPCVKGHWHEPHWPESVRDGELVCPECGARVLLAHGRWRHLNPKAPLLSYRLSRLISPQADLKGLQRQWIEAEGDETKKALFFNFVLGLPYSPTAERFLAADLQRAIGSHAQQAAGERCFLGVDPGGEMHWTVILDREGKIVHIGSYKSFEALCQLMERFNVEHAVCELRPETRLAKAFALRFRGTVSLFEYLPATSELGLRRSELPEGVPLLKMNRTELLDEALAPLRRGERLIPLDAPQVFFLHLEALVRRRVVKRGIEVFVYEATGPDHLAHALAFAHLARRVRTRPQFVSPRAVPRVSPWKL